MKNWSLFGFLILLSGVVAVGISRSMQDAESPANPGMEVYIGEGCIHCHSQYRRPVPGDTDLWGPPSNLAGEGEQETPVLFGNRRQGPDLSNVGIRRSREWNRVHLMDPRLVRPGSRMPSYAYLFDGDSARGESLLDYVDGLGIEGYDKWEQYRSGWTPLQSLSSGNGGAGRSLYAQHCAACHGSSGEGNGPAAGELATPPRDLTERGQWRWVQNGNDNMELELARLIKFGRPGTSMPGTEWLSDEELRDVIAFLSTIRKDSVR